MTLNKGKGLVKKYGSSGTGGLERVVLYADQDETVFVAPGNILIVHLDSIPVESGISGRGTNTITFDTGLNDGQQVILYYAP